LFSFERWLSSLLYELIRLLVVFASVVRGLLLLREMAVEPVVVWIDSFTRCFMLFLFLDAVAVVREFLLREMAVEPVVGLIRLLIVFAVPLFRRCCCCQGNCLCFMRWLSSLLLYGSIRLLVVLCFSDAVADREIAVAFWRWLSSLLMYGSIRLLVVFAVPLFRRCCCCQGNCCCFGRWLSSLMLDGSIRLLVVLCFFVVREISASGDGCRACWCMDSFTRFFFFFSCCCYY
jgi:hypothetical protein